VHSAQRQFVLCTVFRSAVVRDTLLGTEQYLWGTLLNRRYRDVLCATVHGALLLQGC
jgi:hypothetical protein